MDTYKEDKEALKSRRAALIKICSYLPKDILTNNDLAKEYHDWDVDKIFKKTGIIERHIADPDETSSDLGVAAAEKLFSTGICRREEIDFLLFCTETPDYFLPASSCIMQERLGLSTRCGALDFNLGCSGFTYGLALAKSLVESELAEKVLLITADTYSKLIHPKDRSVRTIFGDGAAATLIAPVIAEDEHIGPFIFGTDGSGANRLIVSVGGFRCRPNAETAIPVKDGGGNWRSPENLYMDGPEIFNFTLKKIPIYVTKLLEEARKTVNNIDYFIFHQANVFMLESLRRKLNIPIEKFYINMEYYGNTVSASIPMALESALERGIIKAGDNIMLVGFGVGYSWSATIIKNIMN